MVLGKNHKWFSQDVIVVTQTSAWPDGVLFFTILLWHTLKRSIALRKSSSNSRVSYGPKNKEIYHIWVMRSLPLESKPLFLTSILNVPLPSKLVRNKCMGGNALPNKFVSMDRWHWLLPSYYRSQRHLYPSKRLYFQRTGNEWLLKVHLEWLSHNFDWEWMPSL